MKRKRLGILILAAGLPIALLAWFGFRLARDEQAMLQHQVRELLAGQLRETAQSVERLVGELERDLLRASDLSSFTPDSLRELQYRDPRVTQVFLIASDGSLQHPPVDATASETERKFVIRAQPILDDKELIRERPQEDSARGRLPDKLFTAEPSPAHGWYVWYWGRGLNLIFWRRLEDGRVLGLELNRSRWISELIAQLPKASLQPDGTQNGWQIRLIDSNSNLVYQWGGYAPPPQATAFTELALGEPLASWRLRYFVARSQLAALAGRSVYFNSLAGVAVASLGLIGLIVYLHRESSRELREAETRVSFVNQVSHELRTPLTNIRMYADLLGRDLAELPDESARRCQQRLGIILGESNRLSRLIGNVLTFAKQQRRGLTLRYRSGRLDRLISDIAEQFQPSLANKQIEVRVSGQIPSVRAFDADCVEQILVNLLSNVERYASGGGRLEIDLASDGDLCRIRVADDGPGIAANQREKIFQPFYRVDEGLEGGVGTGIGLAIARELARAHGGDVRLVPSRQGATFEMTLCAPIDKDQSGEEEQT